MIGRADGKTTKHLGSEPLRHSPSLALKIHSGENYATFLVALLLPSPVFLLLLFTFGFLSRVQQVLREPGAT